jgi:hypothetical protein
VGRINMRRVVVGGLLAGLIINISEFILNGVVYAEEMTAAMAALNRPPIPTSAIMVFVLLGFGLGIMTVWLYASIRPRFGPGVGTAVCASLTIWGLAYLYPNIFMIVMNIFPRGMMIVATIWGAVEIVIAGVAGAWAYPEA